MLTKILQETSAERRARYETQVLTARVALAALPPKTRAQIDRLGRSTGFPLSRLVIDGLADEGGADAFASAHAAGLVRINATSARTEILPGELLTWRARRVGIAPLSAEAAAAYAKVIEAESYGVIAARTRTISHVPRFLCLDVGLTVNGIMGRSYDIAEPFGAGFAAEIAEALAVLPEWIAQGYAAALDAAPAVVLGATIDGVLAPGIAERFSTDLVSFALARAFVAGAAAFAPSGVPLFGSRGRIEYALQHYRGAGDVRPCDRVLTTPDKDEP